jgi:hypothetical protein
MIRLFRFILPLAAAAFAAGCSTKPSVIDSSRRGPMFTPKNTTGDKRLPKTLHRVVLLPVHGGEFTPREICESLDRVFSTALEKQMRFEVVTLTRDECQMTFGIPDIASVAALPHNFLSILGEKFDAQGVLFVDITAYQGYRPMLLGLRAKLAGIDDQRIIWSFDEEFSVLDPAVANGARHFYLGNEDGPVPYDPTEGILQSPTRFAAYAADTMFKTLPPR